jgi:hypothetical protein
MTSGSPELTAIKGSPKKSKKIMKNLLDRYSGKRGRGRPVKVVPSAVRGRADNYRVWLTHLWNALGALLLAADTQENVIKAFQTVLPGNNEFPPHAELILKILKDRNFPKRQKARINFLADSLAGLGSVTPRRSRDICAEERSADAERHQILRYEYWIECSCGYKGRSQNHGCKRCGAVIYLPSEGI